MNENIELKNIDEEFLTAKEVAQKLRTTTSTLHNFRRKGTGPKCIKIGCTYKYPIKSLNEYISRQNTYGESGE